MGDLLREITARAAYDCLKVQPCVLGSDRCYPGSGGSHGRCSVRMLFRLVGDRADLTFDLFTGWDHPATPETKTAAAHGGAVSFHAADPWYEDMPSPDDDCPKWGRCYSDVGFLLGNDAFDRLRTGGTDGLWTWMETMFRDTFKAVHADG